MSRFGNVPSVARLLMVMMCVLAASAPPTRAAPVLAQVINGATLTVLAPEVQVSLQGGALGVARDGQTLAPGDYVRTGSGGVALLTFFDGSETQLTFDTQVELDSATRASPITVSSNPTCRLEAVGSNPIYAVSDCVANSSESPSVASYTIPRHWNSS